MVEVATIHIRASYIERLEHLQALHAFRRRKELVVGACVVSCTVFISRLFCLRWAILGSGADSVGVEFLQASRKLGFLNQAMLSALRKGGREGEKLGVGVVREAA